jgi:hypothetical protein
VDTDSTNESTPPSIAGIRSQNAALDAQLRELLARIDADRFSSRSMDEADAWTIGEQLAHLAEFPRFFAADLAAGLDDPAHPVGRTHEHAGRLAAVGAAHAQRLDELVSDVDAALHELAAVLERISDSHLALMTNNRRYGPEPLTAYLDRYVLAHKSGHIRQLSETLAGG